MCPSNQYYRAGVGMIVVNQMGQVLALERIDVPNAWQLPQGGLEVGEEPLDAALRELKEETGLTEGAVELIEVYPQPLAYELPESMRSAKTGRGQVHYWFLFRLKDERVRIDVTSGQEFRTFKWVKMANLLDTVVEFRKPAYRMLAQHFESVLAT